MKRILAILLAAWLPAIVYCQQPSVPEKKPAGTFGAKATAAPTPALPATPDQVWGKLFVDVQLKRALGDNKTFVDAVPKFAPSAILARYSQLTQPVDSAELRRFVEQHFKIPVTYTPELPEQASGLYQHLVNLWPVLTRKADTKEQHSSLLPLPGAYVVPGGRFREIYYWDSYFTMLGLAVSNRFDLIEHMLDNFKYLIDTYGHIPNGNRTYYLSRSQPPYFALMVELLQQHKGDEVYRKYLPALEKEYRWWMDGSATIKPGQHYRRVVMLPDGSLLNRYWDDNNMPRQESYYEDVQTGLVYRRKDGMAYRHLRAGAESGWDFSSRWLGDTATLATIETVNIIPVDLNCLLYSYERIIERALTSQQRYTNAKVFHNRAMRRRIAIQKHCWSEAAGFYFDYNFIQKRTTQRWALAGVLPLFVKIARPQQATAVANHLRNTFLADGGLLTTPYHTGQQWDAPNGWAPLQYLSVTALMNYGHDELAVDIARRWMAVNEKVFANTGKMMEKYNVVNTTLESGGGEYPSQDGFGWSNGVYLKLHSMFNKVP